MCRQLKRRRFPGVQLTMAAAIFLVPAIALAVGYDYQMVTLFGSTFHLPETGSSCGNEEAGVYLQDMTNTWMNTINGWVAYQGSNAMTKKDALEAQLCNSNRWASWCADGQSGGLNSQKVALFSLHGASLPVSIPTAPTFYVFPASYTSTGLCQSQMFDTSRIGLPNLKYLMMLSCDSANQASDLPGGSDQLSGWIATSNKLHVATGFSGIHTVYDNTQTMSDFLWDQGYQGIASAWMSNFTYFNGNSSSCATAIGFGSTYSEAAGRWSEDLINTGGPNTTSNAAVIGYYCNCCADYGNGEGVHCTSSC